MSGPTAGDAQMLALRSIAHVVVAAERLLLALADSELVTAGEAAGAAGLPPAAGHQAMESLRRRYLVAEVRRRYRLTRAGTALAVGVGDPPRPAAGRVVAGVDGSAAARAALRWAAAGADLLVIGARPGSVTRHLTRHAPYPVVLVGPPAG